MPWTVEFHDDFEPEFLALESAVQDALLAVAKLLADYGPQLGRPYADTLKGSKHANMKELRFEASDGEWPLALACQDWANTKAAYRFFSNDRVSEAEILAGHFQATRDRFAATEGPILVVQDLTEFTFQREHPDAVGMTYSINSGKDKAGRYRMHTVCGLLMYFEPGGHHRWPTARTCRNQVLEPAEIQGNRCTQEKDQSDTRTRSSRRKAFAGLRTCASQQRCSRRRRDASTSGIGRVTSMSCSARHRSWAPISWSELALIGWPEMETTRSPARCKRPRWPDSTPLSNGTQLGPRIGVQKGLWRTFDAEG